MEEGVFNIRVLEPHHLALFSSAPSPFLSPSPFLRLWWSCGGYCCSNWAAWWQCLLYLRSAGSEKLTELVVDSRVYYCCSQKQWPLILRSGAGTVIRMVGSRAGTALGCSFSTCGVFKCFTPLDVSHRTYILHILSEGPSYVRMFSDVSYSLSNIFRL